MVIETKIKKGLFRTTVLIGLVGLIRVYSPPDVLADNATTESIKRVEDGLESSTIYSITDLADRLRSEQNMYRMLMPPDADFTLRQPCGMVVFEPKSFPATFTSGLIGETMYGSPVYSLILAEDPASREIVIANADGKEIAAVMPESEYNPYWFLEIMHPDLYSGLYSQSEINELKDSCDPSRIQITLTLLPADFVNTYAKTLTEEQAKLAAELAVAELKNPKLKTGGVIMMKYQSTGMTNLELVSLARATNGMKLTLAYPDNYTNRVDFFTCPDLKSFWWELAVDSTNVISSTNLIEWLDVNASANPLRFYIVGEAGTDSDGDGLYDAREKYLYHTRWTNTDTDNDGLNDSNELFVCHTDPNIGGTNKPNAWISYPSDWSRKVWIP